MKSPRFSFGNRDGEYVLIVDECNDSQDEGYNCENKIDYDDFVVDLSLYVRPSQNNAIVQHDSISLKSNSTDSLYTLFHDLDIYNTDSNANEDDVIHLSADNESFARITYDREQIEYDLRLIDLFPVIRKNTSPVPTKPLQDGVNVIPKRVCLIDPLEECLLSNDFDRVSLLKKADSMFPIEGIISKPSQITTQKEHVVVSDDDEQHSTNHPPDDVIIAAVDSVDENPVQFNNNVFISTLAISDDASENPFITTNIMPYTINRIKSKTELPSTNLILCKMDNSSAKANDYTDNDGILDNFSSDSDIFLAIRGKRAFQNEDLIDPSYDSMYSENIAKTESTAVSGRLQKAAQIVITAASNVLEGNFSQCRHEAFPSSTIAISNVDYLDFFSSNEKSMPGEVTEENSLDVAEKIYQSRIKIAHTIEKLKAKRLVQKGTMNRSFSQSLPLRDSPEVSADQIVLSVDSPNQDNHGPRTEIKGYVMACKNEIKEYDQRLSSYSDRQCRQVSIEGFEESRDDDIDMFESRKDDEKRTIFESENNIINEEIIKRGAKAIDTGASVAKHAFLTLDQLKSMNYSHPSFSKRENLLSDNDFVNCFGMSKMDWKCVPEWKKAIAKRRLGIF